MLPGELAAIVSAAAIPQVSITALKETFAYSGKRRFKHPGEGEAKGQGWPVLLIPEEIFRQI
jgi:hypothetical protein